MPKACSNCRRFHYGTCTHQARDCHGCGGMGHIVAYCPNRTGYIQPTPGEPLAGTQAWCRMHNLDLDPDLRNRVLQTLKRFPGSAIAVNNVCIYPGIYNRFETEDYNEYNDRSRRVRDRSIRRGRSRSPVDERGRQTFRSRSPVRQRSPVPRDDHSPVTLLRYEADEWDAYPRYGLGDREPSPLPLSNAATIRYEDVDEFGAPKFPREPEPQPTKYGRDYTGTIIRGDAELMRSKRSIGRKFIDNHPSVPDFKKVNLPVPVLEAIEIFTRNTSKTEHKENFQPAATPGPLVRFDVKKVSPVVKSISSVFNPQSKALLNVVKTAVAPLQDTTNKLPGSQPTQKQQPIRRVDDDDDENLISFSSPQRRDGDENEPIFLKRAPTRPPPRVADPYFALGLQPGASRERIVQAYNQREWDVNLERDTAYNLEGRAANFTHDGKCVFELSLEVLEIARFMLIGE